MTVRHIPPQRFRRFLCVRQWVQDEREEDRLPLLWLFLPSFFLCSPPPVCSLSLPFTLRVLRCERISLTKCLHVWGWGSGRDKRRGRQNDRWEEENCVAHARLLARVLSPACRFASEATQWAARLQQPPIDWKTRVKHYKLPVYSLYGIFIFWMNSWKYLNIFLRLLHSTSAIHWCGLLIKIYIFF